MLMDGYKSMFEHHLSYLEVIIDMTLIYMPRLDVVEEQYVQVFAKNGPSQCILLGDQPKTAQDAQTICCEANYLVRGMKFVHR